MHFTNLLKRKNWNISLKIDLNKQENLNTVSNDGLAPEGRVRKNQYNVVVGDNLHLLMTLLHPEGSELFQETACFNTCESCVNHIQPGS